MFNKHQGWCPKTSCSQLVNFLLLGSRYWSSEETVVWPEFSVLQLLQTMALMLFTCFISASQTLYTLCTSSPFRCKPVKGHDPICWRLDWKDIFNAWDPSFLQTSESYLRPWTHWKCCKLELFRIDCLLKWFQQWQKSPALFFTLFFSGCETPSGCQNDCTQTVFIAVAAGLRHGSAAQTHSKTR